MQEPICPLWVKSRHRVTSASCPLFPSKQTFINAVCTELGLVFGASETRLYGRVSNIRYPSDAAGVYGGAGAGAALLVGARAIVLRNEKGAVLTLSGRQVGLIANADLSGLAPRCGNWP